MRDLAIQAAGGIAILTAIVHGVLGETKIFAKAHIEPAWIKLMLRLIWQCGTVAWVGFGVLLVAAPHMGSDVARLWIAGAAIGTYSVAAVSNAWVTRGRQVGWVAMTVASALALVGA